MSRSVCGVGFSRTCSVDVLVEALPVSGDCLLGGVEVVVAGADELVQLVFESVFEPVAGGGVELLGEEVGDVVGSAELERDDVVDLQHLPGTIISARQLADAYGITDTDGSRPDCWGHLAAYGWEQDDGRGIDEFR
jgi:hypothetical protein